VYHFVVQKVMSCETVQFDRIANLTDHVTFEWPLQSTHFLHPNYKNCILLIRSFSQFYFAYRAFRCGNWRQTETFPL